MHITVGIAMVDTKCPEERSRNMTMIHSNDTVVLLKYKIVPPLLMDVFCICMVVLDL